MAKTLNRHVALLFVLGALAIAYVLAFVPLHNLIGDLVFLPAALLVAGVGWLWGLWVGLFAGVLTFPLLLLLLNLDLDRKMLRYLVGKLSLCCLSDARSQCAVDQVDRAEAGEQE